MANKDIRWKQRFQNFEKAFQFFEDIVGRSSLTAIEISGLVQAFEFTFELGWKTIKDYLYEQGIETRFPREAIKKGFEAGIITDGHTWIHMLEKRNELAHTYNSAVANHAVEIIKQRYYISVKQVYEYFKQHLND